MELGPKQPDNTYVEFSNINSMYYGKKYRYGYALRNAYKLHNEVVKYDFDTGTEITYPLPNGLFGSEPLFVPNPGMEYSQNIILLTLTKLCLQEKTMKKMMDSS